MSFDMISGLHRVALPFNAAIGNPYISFALSTWSGVTGQFFIMFIHNNALNASIPGAPDV